MNGELGNEVGLRGIGVEQQTADLAKRGQAQVAVAVLDQETLGDRIDAVDDGCGVDPVHDLVLVAAGGRGVSAGLGIHERRSEAALHGFGNRQDVVTAGFGIAGLAVVIGHAVAADAQFLEFGAVGVPLEHDALGPVVPEGCSDDDVLIDVEDAGAAAFRNGMQNAFALDLGEAGFGRLAVDVTVLLGKVDVGGVVVALMNRQAAGVGMVAAEAAAGRGPEALRKMRAIRAVIEHRRKDAGEQTAGEGRVVCRVQQAGREQLLHDRLLLGGGEAGAVQDAGLRVGDSVIGLHAEVVSLQLVDLVEDEAIGGIHQWGVLGDLDGSGIAGARRGLGRRGGLSIRRERCGEDSAEA